MEYIELLKQKIEEARFTFEEVSFEDDWGRGRIDNLKILIDHYNHWLSEFQVFVLNPMSDGPNRIDLQLVAVGGARGALYSLSSINDINEDFYKEKIDKIVELETLTIALLHKKYRIL